MRHFLIAAVVAIAAGSAAYAQDMPKADPDAAAPTKRMDEGTPTMKAPEAAQQRAPTKQVGDAVPSIKSTDPQSADTGTKTGALVADEQWIGRYVYSSDGKDLGKVASINKNGNLSQVSFDMGGFLGLGATRKSVTSDQIQEVQYDRVVLRLTEAEAKGLNKAREFNFQRYHFQGIGRYPPEGAYARGLGDLGVLARLTPASGYVHGEKPTSVDAGIYGFIANIHFYDIDTPLKQCVASHPNLVRHCEAIHAAVSK